MVWTKFKSNPHKIPMLACEIHFQCHCLMVKLMRKSQIWNFESQLESLIVEHPFGCITFFPIFFFLFNSCFFFSISFHRYIRAWFPSCHVKNIQIQVLIRKSQLDPHFQTQPPVQSPMSNVKTTLDRNLCTVQLFWHLKTGRTLI